MAGLKLPLDCKCRSFQKQNLFNAEPLQSLCLQVKLPNRKPLQRYQQPLHRSAINKTQRKPTARTAKET